MSKERSVETGWAVITGASSGLGAIFAEQLAKRGLSLVLTGRDEPRLTTVQERVRQITPGVDVELVQMEFKAYLAANPASMLVVMQRKDTNELSRIVVSAPDLAQ